MCSTRYVCIMLCHIIPYYFKILLFQNTELMFWHTALVISFQDYLTAFLD